MGTTGDEAAEKGPAKKAGPTKAGAKKAAAKKTATKKVVPKKQAAATKSRRTTKATTVDATAELPTEPIPQPEPIPEPEAEPEPEPVLEEPVAADSAIVDETLADTPAAPDDDGPPTLSKVDRAKALAAAAALKAEETRKRLEARRERSRTVDTAFGFAEHDASVGGGVLAGAVAFRVFLFLIPYVFVIVTIIAMIADILGQGRRSFANATGAAGIAANAVSASGDQSFLTRFFSLGVGIFALYLGASALLKVLRIVHGLAWRVPTTKPDRPARAVGLLVLIVTSLVVVATLISSIRDGSLLLFVVATLLYICVPAAIWLVVSMRALPHPPGTTWRDLLPGALTVGVGLQLLQLITVVWITHLVESKSSTYGAIGVALALLFWAYVLGRIICAGAVLNAALWWRDHDEAPPGPPAVVGHE